MQSQNIVFLAGDSDVADVGTPQAANLHRLPCHSVSGSVMVISGRAKSAVNNNLVPDVSDDTPGPQEGWSRGCRRAESFWLWLWSPLWLPAPKKKKLSWSSRSRSSLSTPASTSNIPGRARRLSLTGPAPHPLLPGMAGRASGTSAPRSEPALRWACGNHPALLHFGPPPCAIFSGHTDPAACFRSAHHLSFQFVIRLSLWATVSLCRIGRAHCIDRSKDRC